MAICFRIIFLILASAQLIQHLGATETDIQPPNIVLLIADDLGYGELNDSLTSKVPTPHLQRLAAHGTSFTQAYVTAPNCSPSRAGLLTGRTPTRFGYEYNPIGPRNDDPKTGLPSHETTIAEFLKHHGYTSGLIGKWHLGGAADFHPLRHGFDEFCGFLHEGHFYQPPPWTGVMSMLRRAQVPMGRDRFWINDSLLYSNHTGRDEPAYDANNPILRNSQPIQESGYLTDIFAEEAVDFIRRYKSTRFFLTVAFNAVHSPLQAKRSTYDQVASIQDVHRRIFAAMLVDMDAAIGRVMSALDEHHLQQNTLVFFLSDNGGPTRELTSNNFPFKGEKGSMYEGGIRVPMIASWPNRLPADTECDQVVSSLDIYSTIAQAVGGQIPSQVEGQDLVGMMNQQLESKHHHLFWRQGERAAFRSGDWKIVCNRTDAKKMRVWELYNLKDDVSESDNLANAQPARLRALVESWEQHNSQMLTPLFDP